MCSRLPRTTLLARRSSGRPHPRTRLPPHHYQSPAHFMHRPNPARRARQPSAYRPRALLAAGLLPLLSSAESGPPRGATIDADGGSGALPAPRGRPRARHCHPVPWPRLLTPHSNNFPHSTSPLPCLHRRLSAGGAAQDNHLVLHRPRVPVGRSPRFWAALMRALREGGACTCLHACARMSALASACSAMLMFVSCRRQLQHGQRHMRTVVVNLRVYM